MKKTEYTKIRESDAQLLTVLKVRESKFRETFPEGLTIESLDMVLRRGLSRVAAEQRFAAKKVSAS